ncbi:universal stress protein [uncultured Enterococcus sp.]|uniref:universal stress protein n=1 Tax=uncultured Enterococcus sp. TaxID=167972 RepID=UPI0025F28109|nr:universal stress protein [uncultured Enterococcus sp.]
MRTILVAFDGSQHALNAVKEARKFQRVFPEARVTILKVLKVAKAKDECLDLSLTIEEKKRIRIKTVEKELADLVEHDTIDIVVGDPAKKIIEYVQEHTFDLVIMGTRGRKRLKEIVLGSVSHEVSTHVDTPVLIVK